MATSVHHHPGHDDPAGPTPIVPFDLTVEPIARFMNCELADHPVYDGVEVQWFDDPVHGTGMLAFLSRREDRTADFSVQPGLRLDRDMFTVGAGIRSWREHDFGDSRIEVAEDGVQVDVRFTDTDGRPVEILVDDRDGRPRTRASLLAPFGADIDDPKALLLAYLTEFDLVRLTGAPPTVRIDGVEVSTGRLPGQRLHRRALVKYGSGLVIARLNRNHDGPVAPADDDGPGDVALAADGAVTGLSAGSGTARARLRLDPGLPDLSGLPDGEPRRGGWRLDIAGDRITGGVWTVLRQGDRVDLMMEVTRRWDPPRLPLMMEAVTRIVPTFRRWPTTYRWTATVALSDAPTMTSRWERTGERDDGYRRATGSAGT